MCANKYQVKDDALRRELFPKVKDSDLWDRRDRSRIGFSTIPKAMPILIELMDELSPGKPIGKTYFAIWCRSWDTPPFVRLGRAMHDITPEAGFFGPRARNSLMARLGILKRLGLVHFAKGSSGDHEYALIPNPYLVLEKHRANLSESNWNALLQRMSDIGATDLKKTKPAPPPVPNLLSPERLPPRPKPRVDLSGILGKTTSS